ncbi:MAG: hypothetical protein GY716_14485 [bacterium]|nr:hypothetical protein [bacterium]
MLRPRPRQATQPSLERQVRELSAQGLLGAEAGDAAIVRAGIPGEYPEYLQSVGLAVPNILPHPQIDRRLRLRPFGWSREAIELNAAHERPVAHPSLECLARVNSRSFACGLEREIDADAPLSAVIEAPADLERRLAGFAPDSAWLVKSEFGHAGLSNRRVRAGAICDADRSFVERRLQEDDRLIVEPWLDRRADWCSVFDVPFRADTLRIHETVYTRDGAPIGALFAPAHEALEPWRPALERSAATVASGLQRAGYFGPVCVDSFVWHADGRERLRLLADLNARRSMSDGAHRLWSGRMPGRTLYYRFFNRRKLSLPVELPGMCEALGDRAYADGRGGILFASPPRLRIDGVERPTAKLAVAFVGRTRDSTLESERWFRQSFEPRRAAP